jgi:hypothetical protein
MGTSGEQLRQAVWATFAEFGVPDEELQYMRECLLVQDGRFVGRSYRAGDLLAMWLADVNLVQFYGAEGEMLRTLEICHGQETSRRAA